MGVKRIYSFIVVAAIYLPFIAVTPDSVVFITAGSKQQQRTGNGIILNGNRILTNAHIVSGAASVYVRNKNSKDFQAYIKYLGPDCDLAILELWDNSFFEKEIPFTFSGYVPEKNELVNIFPSEFPGRAGYSGKYLGERKARYEFAGTDFKNVFEIETGISEGISGSPAFSGKNLIGIAFQSKTGKENKTQIIPGSIISHFLEDIKDGEYDGFPGPGFHFQNGSHKTPKKFFNIPADREGIFITSVYPSSTFAKALQEKDFLFSINGYPLDNAGNVQSGKSVTIALDEFIWNKFVREEITVGYIRNGETRQSKVRLKPNPAFLFYSDSEPVFIQCGDFQFSPVNRTIFNRTLVSPGSPVDYHYRYFFHDRLYLDSDRAIALTGVKPGTEDFWKHSLGRIVESVNGVYPGSISGFRKLCEFPNEKIKVITLQGSDLPIITGNR